MSKTPSWSILCFSTDNWGKRKARKHHLMLQLSFHPRVKGVLYIEPPLNLLRLFFLPWQELAEYEQRWRWKRALFCRIERLAEKLFLYTPIFPFPFFYRLPFIYRLNQLLILPLLGLKLKKLGLSRYILWLYHPFDRVLIRKLKGYCLSCLDWTEPWSTYFMGLSKRVREEVRREELHLVQEVNLMFTPSPVLLEEAMPLNDHSFFLPHGASVELLRRPWECPSEIRSLPRPFIGYVGNINERFNLDILECLSNTFPEVSLILVGEVHWRRVGVERLKNLAMRRNIYLLGGRPFELIPAYLKAFDVCIIPYRPELTVGGPTKLYDYLATGKPVISTPFPETWHFGKMIRVAEAEKFVQMVREALEEDNPRLREQRMAWAQDNSWSARASEVVRKIEELCG